MFNFEFLSQHLPVNIAQRVSSFTSKQGEVFKSYKHNCWKKLDFLLNVILKEYNDLEILHFHSQQHIVNMPNV